MKRTAGLFHSGFSKDVNTEHKLHSGFEPFIFREITERRKQTYYCDHVKVLKD